MEQKNFESAPGVISHQAADLPQICRRLRQMTLQTIFDGGTGHPGGSLSAADMVACLYFRELRLRPEDPEWPDRDRFILSKGHACPVLYAALALRGFFAPEILPTLRQTGSMLQGHPDMSKTPGIEMNTGSLGLGISAGVGMALGLRLQGKPARVYVLMGDGEQNEGSVWEAAMFSSHHKLDNLVAIIDYNKIQAEGFTAEIMDLEPLAEKWRSFGWRVVEIDGHDLRQILEALETARQEKGKPTCIIAHTIKGKGVSFMENNPKWHGSAPPSAEELALALGELQGIRGQG